MALVEKAQETLEAEQGRAHDEAGFQNGSVQHERPQGATLEQMLKMGGMQGMMGMMPGMAKIRNSSTRRASTTASSSARSRADQLTMRRKRNAPAPNFWQATARNASPPVAGQDVSDLQQAAQDAAPDGRRDEEDGKWASKRASLRGGLGALMGKGAPAGPHRHGPVQDDQSRSPAEMEKAARQRAWAACGGHGPGRPAPRPLGLRGKKK